MDVSLKWVVQILNLLSNPNRGRWSFQTLSGVPIWSLNGGPGIFHFAIVSAAISPTAWRPYPHILACPDGKFLNGKAANFFEMVKFCLNQQTFFEMPDFLFCCPFMPANLGWPISPIFQNDTIFLKWRAISEAAGYFWSGQIFFKTASIFDL